MHSLDFSRFMNAGLESRSIVSLNEISTQFQTFHIEQNVTDEYQAPINRELSDNLDTMK
jgi:hypothetical protein